MNVTRRLEALRSASPGLSISKGKEEIPNPDDLDGDETTTSTDKDKEKKPMTEEIDKAKAEGHDAGFKAANDRMNAVFASTHFEGRETQAKAMLAKAMSAEDIIDILAVTPKIESSALVAEIDTEAVQRQVMADAIAKNVNSAVQAGADDFLKSDAKAKSAGVWERANAKIEQRRGN